MCGIFSLLFHNKNIIYDNDKIQNEFNKGINRGPEHSVLEYYDNIVLGFHRLAINGLNDKSNQPIVVDGIRLICNGEIYNYKELYKKYHFTPTTDSDCEIIIHLYKQFGLLRTLTYLDGVFAFVLYDENTKRVHVARDPFGVRPLFYLSKKNTTLGFASEMKQLIEFKDINDSLTQFPPGQFLTITVDDHPSGQYAKSMYSYKDMYKTPITMNSNNILKHIYLDSINNNLTNAVLKRTTSTERPVACLLSGGLDSSLICALVAETFKDKSKLETFSIGLLGSEDLKYAKIVADHLGTTHHEIIVSEDDFFDAIPEVIRCIESYDTTTVRASVGNYLVGKYIKNNSDAKVIFNGDGSDELAGGYLYMHNCDNDNEFDKECKRLLHNIHYFDVLRSDRCISSHGLEARTPFLDKTFVYTYLQIPSTIRNHNNNKNIEKYLIREAFDENNLLPKEILWRRKEAFSDGVSSLKKSWYEIINEKLDKIDIVMYNSQLTKEQNYYKNIYDSHYKNIKCIPYYWMPKYSTTTDCSARTLTIYNKL